MELVEYDPTYDEVVASVVSTLGGKTFMWSHAWDTVNMCLSDRKPGKRMDPAEMFEIERCSQHLHTLSDDVVRNIIYLKKRDVLAKAGRTQKLERTKSIRTVQGGVQAAAQPPKTRSKGLRLVTRGHTFKGVKDSIVSESQSQPQVNIQAPFTSPVGEPAHTFKGVKDSTMSESQSQPLVNIQTSFTSSVGEPEAVFKKYTPAAVAVTDSSAQLGEERPWTNECVPYTFLELKAGDATQEDASTEGEATFKKFVPAGGSAGERKEEEEEEEEVECVTLFNKEPMVKEKEGGGGVFTKLTPAIRSTASNDATDSSVHANAESVEETVAAGEIDLAERQGDAAQQPAEEAEQGEDCQQKEHTQCEDTQQVEERMQGEEEQQGEDTQKAEEWQHESSLLPTASAWSISDATLKPGSSSSQSTRPGTVSNTASRPHNRGTSRGTSRQSSKFATAAGSEAYSLKTPPKTPPGVRVVQEQHRVMTGLVETLEAAETRFMLLQQDGRYDMLSTREIEQDSFKTAGSSGFRIFADPFDKATRLNTSEISK